MVYDVKGLFKVVVCDLDLVLFFENKKCYKLIKEDVLEDDYIVLIGKVNVFCEGVDIMVIGYS